jgi:hypothetical protein
VRNTYDLATSASREQGCKIRPQFVVGSSELDPSPGMIPAPMRSTGSNRGFGKNSADGAGVRSRGPKMPTGPSKISPGTAL